MNTAKAYRALKETARRNDVSLDTVIKEIERAIAIGMANPDPKVQAFWRSVPKAGEAPTPVELVAYISELEQRRHSSNINAGRWCIP